LIDIAVTVEEAIIRLGGAVGRTLDTQATLRKLRAMRRRGESYSDVILRLAAAQNG
jgi:hypothetical protein